MPEFISPDDLNIFLNSYVDSYGYRIDQLTYNFVSKERQLLLNKEFLNHNTHTDVITFDYSKNKSLKAEFFISLWAVTLSAKEFSQSIENETIRVIVHGILHCLGYKDDSKRDKHKMRELEDKFIEMFHVKQKKNV
jgi:rRNA maturation RNase YbeY